MRTTIIAAVLAAITLTAVPAGASSICGDVNGNGSVTATDALAVLRKAVGQAIDLLCAPSGSQPLKTGQTTSYGAGTDGDVQKGAARSFTDNGDGTVTDNASGLMWEKKDASGGIHDRNNLYTWSSGSGSMDGTVVSLFLASLNGGGGFGGHTDWRVPNIVELQTLVNYDIAYPGPTTYSEFNNKCFGACTVTTCSCTSADYYWSSSTYQSDTSYTWLVGFLDGYTGDLHKTNGVAVRAVRGGA